MSTIRSSREPRKGPQRALWKARASEHKQASISKQAMWNAKGKPIAQSVGEPAQWSVGALWEDSGSARAMISITARDSGQDIPFGNVTGVT